ncbi:hypothetical protein [Methylocaldum szegediense]|mgnify:CR=1 FL=1|uniref:hypothetical protein n=1 Tax=Methylocaldum szegediense TaxID=73780 RepID=UPI0003F4F52E|nr:hypothetical protein [Methylocaldum szegediense]
MTAIHWKRQQPRSLRHGMELCLEHARVKANASVDRIADLMGLANKWVLYKWMESGRLPAVLIRPFETACGIDYVTRYLSHSARKLLVDIPTGRKATGRDINSLQASFAEAVAVLLRHYEGKTPVDETVAALTGVLEELAWHRAEVERRAAPQMDVFEEVTDE